MKTFLRVTQKNLLLVRDFQKEVTQIVRACLTKFEQNACCPYTYDVKR